MVRLTRDMFFYLAGGETVEAFGDWTGTALAADRAVIKVVDD